MLFLPHKVGRGGRARHHGRMGLYGAFLEYSYIQLHFLQRSDCKQGDCGRTEREK